MVQATTAAAPYQATGESVSKKMEAFYHTLDGNEQRVFDGLLHQMSHGAEAAVDHATVTVNTPLSLRTSSVIKLVSKVACW